MDALCAGVTFVALVTLFALDALRASVTFFAFVTLFTLDALCAGVTFIALVTFFALDTLRAGVTFIALVTFVALYTLCGNAGIGVADPPVAVCTDKGGETVYTILAVYTVFAVLAVHAIFAVLAVRAGRTSAAARADQRRKPFLLRADKAVFDRDVIGRKPHNTAGRAGSGTRLFDRCIKRGVSKQLLRD